MEEDEGHMKNVFEFWLLRLSEKNVRILRKKSELK